MIAYVLDHLINHCKLQQINLVTKSFGQKIKSFVKKHFKVNNCKIDYIESSFQTVGDIFRYKTLPQPKSFIIKYPGSESGRSDGMKVTDSYRPLSPRLYRSLSAGVSTFTPTGAL